MMMFLLVYNIEYSYYTSCQLKLLNKLIGSLEFPEIIGNSSIYTYILMKILYI